MPSIGTYNRYLRVSGDFTVPVLRDVPAPRYPYNTDNSIYEWVEPYTIARQMYQQSRPNPGARHPKYPNMYFVKDTEISSGRSTIADFDRIWLALPTTTKGRQGYLVTTYEDYPFVVPGRGTGAEDFFLADVTSYSRSGGYLTMVRSGHDVTAGMLIRVEYLVIDPINGAQYAHSIVTEALTGTVAGTSVVIADIQNDKGTAIPRRFRRNDIVQQPYPRTVTARIEKEHIVLGVNGIASFNDINRITRFLDVIGADGNRTETLNTDSEPSIDDYNTKVKNKEWIVAEDSTIANYEGTSGILVKTIKYVQAIW
jgi:hypothetical protein